MGLTTWHLPARWDGFTDAVVRPVLIVVVVASLIPLTWAVMFPSPTGSALAGQGGVPGGREAGKWVGANLVPGTELMTIGPSMANILEYYGHRPAQGLSVSTDPLHRNPAYTPIYNPDRACTTGQFSYLVWDAYSASRSPSTARRLAGAGGPVPRDRHPHACVRTASPSSSSTRSTHDRPALGRATTALAAVAFGIDPASGLLPQAATTRSYAPIQHVIVVMQSGHSFDNYFGTRPGVNGSISRLKVPTASRHRREPSPACARTISPPTRPGRA